LEEAYLQMLELHCVESEKEAEQLDSTYLSRYSSTRYAVVAKVLYTTSLWGS
jgi:hypothetical protein